MGKKEKLLDKIQSDSMFTFDELKTLLINLGYQEKQGAGSRVSFYTGNSTIRLHKPHPNNELKQYPKKQIITELKVGGFL